MRKSTVPGLISRKVIWELVSEFTKFKSLSEPGWMSNLVDQILFYLLGQYLRPINLRLFCSLVSNKAL
jgi:hypothetical protein